MRCWSQRIFWCICVLASFLSPVETSLRAENIDIVYTWVDGSDTEWQALRDMYHTLYRPFLINYDANTKNRYRNRDELKYSLRSVYQFADFVHHIYIVTAGQKPVWLKPHPKITIVSHREIFLKADDLPTFNSQAIESNLHRIPNLAEKFIYLNDDVLFGAKVALSDFFTDTGLIRVNLSERKVSKKPLVVGECAYNSAWKNTNAILNIYFKKEKRFKLCHAPFALKKSIMQDAEQQFPYVFQAVSSHKFRMSSDFTMTNGLVQYYALYTKRAKFGREPSPMIRIHNDTKLNKNACQNLKIKECKFFCVEDVTIEDNPLVDLQIHNFFESSFPTPAPWEK
ncbi:MAG: hypothetical protein JWO53_386 [Chlamydiia bacterium]|nr:hypothetical protein [Chlamydiia bacterium]